MNKKFGLFILLGLFLGGTFGIFFAAPLENPLLGVAIGALGGVFIGWFIAAEFTETKNPSNNSQTAQPKPHRGMWIGIGLALGAGIGMAMQNLTVGMGIGLLMGVVMETLQVRKVG
ncbi:MAG: hypothetical protein JNM55_18285 [Anaerolineales bacterium]|nr:hypothetical protein [Anaerolineales bacterium]